MDDAPLPSTACRVALAPLSSDDIRRLSVRKITNTVLFDANNVPSQGGLYDPALGPVKQEERCQTCCLLHADCPGHYGHIDLAVPIFHPLFLPQTIALLRGSCRYCHHFLMPRQQLTIFVAKLKLLDCGLVDAAAAIDTLADQALAAQAAERFSARGGDPAVSDDPAAFGQRIGRYVDQQIRRHGPRTGPDGYKVQMAFARRRQVIADFLRETSLPKSCATCNGPAFRIRRERYLKLIERQMKRAQRAPGQDVVRQDGPALEAMLRTLDVGAKRTDNYDSGYDTRESDSDEERGEVRRQASPATDDDDSGAEVDGTMPTEGGPAARPHGARTMLTPTIVDAVASVPPTGPRAGDDAPTRVVERTLSSSDCQLYLRLLFHREREMCDQLYRLHGQPDGRSAMTADLFFMSAVVVPPNRFRPPTTMAGVVYENEQTGLLNAVLQANTQVRACTHQLRIAALESKDERFPIDVRAVRTRLHAAVVGLQGAVNGLMDKKKSSAYSQANAAPGVKQLLDHKDGIFRMNMMGKRVNYSARSVISPDVNIETNEIGIPPVFAKKLTYAEPVTSHNVPYLQQLILNGAKQHPGAVYIEREDGQVISLEHKDEEERAAWASQLLTLVPTPMSRGVDTGQGKPRMSTRVKKVHRHLDNGDIVILNRQPTLHKPSMMCHRARILPGERTIRMHYANCNSYNADFDGDEMNVHFPQSMVAQAEAKLIANTDNQYLVPTSGSPVRGLIQDHVVAGVWLTCKDSFFTRTEYQQALMACLRPESGFHQDGSIRLLPPALLRPAARWTGKQLISTILLNIRPEGSSGLSLRAKSKIAAKAWGPGHEMEELVIVDDGQLLSGILDKSQFGASNFGLVHAIYEVYGPETAGIFLSVLSRLFSYFLQRKAFSCRLDDLLLTVKGDEIRDRLLQNIKDRGRQAATDLLGIKGATDHEVATKLEGILRDDSKLALLDVAVKSKVSPVTSDVIRECLPENLGKLFPRNNMQAMTTSGAKGSAVNASQISCLLGQQELEGRRVPIMVSGKTLPSFMAFETAPRAGGFVAQRFLTGVLPQEFYFHCMAGREGLIDTAVKTARSGYLQRCLIKHLEGIRVHYDNTVRQSDGSVLQFVYGDDAIDVTKSRWLYDCDFAVRNRQSYLDRFQPQMWLGKLDESAAPAYSAAILRKLRLRHKGKAPEDFLKHLPDPTLTLYSPSTFIGAISERFAEAVDLYSRENPSRMLTAKSKRMAAWPQYVQRDQLYDANAFVSLMFYRYMKSLVDPGEPVGILASQGIGEPSTQMTLNTFHFAGHGAANVTLGIPRLREVVLQAAVNIATPTMRLPFLDTITEPEQERFCQHKSRLLLSEIVDGISVKETVCVDENGADRHRAYEVRMTFFPREQYEAEFATTPEELLDGLSRTLVLVIDKYIGKDMHVLAHKDRSSVSLGRGITQKGDVGTHDDQEADDEAIDASGAPEAVANLLDVEAEEDDFDDAKRASRRGRPDVYDDEDIEDSGDDVETDPDDNAVSHPTPGECRESDFDELWGATSDAEEGSLQDPDETIEHRKERQARAERMRRAEQRALANTRYVTELTFDKSDGQWVYIRLRLSVNAPKLVMTSIMERACKSCVLRQHAGISRCLRTPPTPQDPAAYCTTEGANLYGCWRWGSGVLDLDRMYTNDVAAMLSVYGVEAARETIIAEMSTIFGAYGIGVDRRHLLLVADYMTADGGYRSFSRVGLATSISPFQKASFEMTTENLALAAISGDFDTVKTPTSGIALGQAPLVGSGTFAVLAPIPAP